MSPGDAPGPRPPAEAEPCSVGGCTELSERSISLKEARKAFPALPDAHRAHLCRSHYREWKKSTKKDRELRRLGW